MTEKLEVFDKMYTMYATDLTYASVAKKDCKPLWGDCALFNLLRDMIIMGCITKDELPTRVKKMYVAFAALPGVSDWINKQRLLSN